MSEYTVYSKILIQSRGHYERLYRQAYKAGYEMRLQPDPYVPFALIVDRKNRTVVSINTETYKKVVHNDGTTKDFKYYPSAKIVTSIGKPKRALKKNAQKIYVSFDKKTWARYEHKLYMTDEIYEKPKEVQQLSFIEEGREELKGEVRYRQIEMDSIHDAIELVSEIIGRCANAPKIYQCIKNKGKYYGMTFTYEKHPSEIDIEILRR